MKEGINLYGSIEKKSSYTLQADAFDESRIRDYLLCLKVSRHSLSFCAIEQYTNLVCYYRTVLLDAYHNDKALEQLLRQLWHSEPLLQTDDWAEVRLVVSNQKCVLVPNRYLQDNAFDFFRLNAVTDTNSAQIISAKDEKLGLTAVFSIENALKARISQSFPSAPVRYLHTNPLFLGALLDEKKPPITKHTISVLFEHNRMLVAQVSGGKVLFLNSFSLKTPEDALYYLLFVCDELGISPRESSLTCWGTVRKNDPEYLILEKHIKAVQTGMRPQSLLFPNNLQTLPQSADLDLFSAGTLS